MSARAAAACVLAVGCGRIDFAPRSDASSCTPGPWSSPTPLAATLNNSTTTWGGQISPDGLTLYYSAATVDGQRTFVAQRASRAEAFTSGQPTNVAIAMGDNDDDPSLTGDQLEMWFDRATQADAERLYSTTRAAIGQAWTPPIVQSALDDNGVTDAPWISLDGLTVYYTDVDTSTVVMQTRASRADTFSGAGQPVPLATGASVGTPWLSADQLAIYFQSTTGAGGTNELWQAGRQTIADGFGVPSRIPGIGAPGGDDVDSSLTADGLELYFASTRADGMTYEIYVATRACE